MRFAMVAAGSGLALGSLALPWLDSGSSAIPGYRLPSAISVLSKAGLIGRWHLIPWAIVPLGAIAAWLILWVRHRPGPFHTMAGCLIAVSGAYFTLQSGPALGTALSIAGGILIALGGLWSRTPKGKSR